MQGVFQERVDGRIKFFTYVVREGTTTHSGETDRAARRSPSQALAVDDEQSLGKPRGTMDDKNVDDKKKMTLVQLTVIVAVNMMGSGIIMLPANMAKVGAISLLSWGVTAVGSMAIAYGFAQAGLFNQRPGGMSAYAEDAHGKAGFFMTFYLYFFSLAIGNVAIAISAVGYLATFFPWLSSTPIATCVGVIGLVWLTTVANFGGPNSPGGSAR